MKYENGEWYVIINNWIRNGCNSSCGYLNGMKLQHLRWSQLTIVGQTARFLSLPQFLFLFLSFCLHKASQLHVRRRNGMTPYECAPEKKAVVWSNPSGATLPVVASWEAVCSKHGCSFNRFILITPVPHANDANLQLTLSSLAVFTRSITWSYSHARAHKATDYLHLQINLLKLIFLSSHRHCARNTFL